MKRTVPILPLGEILTIQNGYAFNSKLFKPEGGTPLIRIRDLKSGTNTQTTFTGEYDEKYLVKAGDLLIGMDGEFGCYEWRGEPALLNQRVCRLQGFSSELHPRYLFYGINSYLKDIEDVTGFTTVKHLSSKQILGIEFPLPPLSEQRRIVGILDEAFEGIATAKANAEKNLKNARAIFESHLNEVFTKKGEGWVETRLGELIESSIIGLTRSSKEQGVDKQYPYVKMNHITRDNRFEFTDYVTVDAGNEEVERFALKDGDFLFNTRNSHELVGKSCIYSAAAEGVVLFNNNIMRIRFRPDIDARFVLFAFLSRTVAEELGGLKSGTTNVSAIYFKDLRNLGVPLPTTTDQRGIADKLDTLRAETQRLESIYQQKIDALEALKKSLLHQAFSGGL